jgi:hypothetical protein
MNPRPLIAALSLSGVGLAAAVAWISTRPAAFPVSDAVADAASTGDSRPVIVTRVVKYGAAAGWNFNWTSVATNDLRAYIRNLREVKCPEQTVRDIIIAEVNREFAPREAPYKVAESPIPPPGEKPSQRDARLKLDYQRRRSLRLVEKEKVAVIKDLLGVEIPLDPLRGWHNRNYERMESAINGVPAEKRERVREILEAYWELSDTLNDERNVAEKGRDVNFVERYKENNERRRLALGQVLTPDEFELFEMRASSVADRLRTQLSEFKPTEAEFREIYRLRRDIEEPFGGTMTTGNVNEYKQDPEAENRYRQQIETLLGSERLAAFDRAQNPVFQNLASLRERFNLTPEQVDQAFDILGQQAAVTRHVETSPDGRTTITETGSGRPAAEQWSQIGQILGNDAFTVLGAMIPGGDNTRQMTFDGPVPPEILRLQKLP